MARIRSIKPEFWTSGQLLECSTNARLMFIGLWNFADDEGRHPYRPKQIKAQIFPADDFTEKDILGMLLELSKNSLITTYAVDNEQYFTINGWHHQRIDKPQPAKYPPPFHEHSGNVLGTIPPDRIGKDRIREERKEEKAVRPRFVKPSVEDVAAYCIERKNQVNAQAFIDHYEANGWKRGKNSVVDWKACVRTWESTRQQQPDITRGAK